MKDTVEALLINRSSNAHNLQKKWQLVLIKQIKWALLRKCKTKNEKQLKKGELKQRSVQRNTIKKSKRKQIISVHC